MYTDCLRVLCVTVSISFLVSRQTADTFIHTNSKYFQSRGLFSLTSHTPAYFIHTVFGPGRSRLGWPNFLGVVHYVLTFCF